MTATCLHCGAQDVELVDVSDMLPSSLGACAECEHEIVADSHDDDTCTCLHCCRSRARADRVAREAEARVRGGLSVMGMEALGEDFF